MVLQGMDKIKAANKDYGRFDSWLKTFNTVLEGRGIMGSVVGASTDIKQMISKTNSDMSVTEYAVRLYTQHPLDTIF